MKKINTFPDGQGGYHLTQNKHLAKQSIVDYMSPVHHPITKKSTVQKVFEISQAATKYMGQNDNLTTVSFDLAVAREAYDVLW